MTRFQFSVYIATKTSAKPAGDTRRDGDDAEPREHAIQTGGLGIGAHEHVRWNRNHEHIHDVQTDEPRLHGDEISRNSGIDGSKVKQRASANFESDHLLATDYVILVY